MGISPLLYLFAAIWLVSLAVSVGIALAGNSFNKYLLALGAMLLGFWFGVAMLAAAYTTYDSPDGTLVGSIVLTIVLTLFVGALELCMAMNTGVPLEAECVDRRPEGIAPAYQPSAVTLPRLPNLFRLSRRRPSYESRHGCGSKSRRGVSA